ncbi:MAG TPA: sigma-70 family RNA polymerase sigma factor [Gemmatimonadaceae bacterium]|jgi:RNA polymerase sigma-70 factor (ECF subfamily)|nr:sigma-70 family RNA polymerase sigma factor [Gemmatimonadaceae bacterium]
MAWKYPAGEEEMRLHLLVLRCQTGDERAFRQLFDTYNHQTMSYLQGMLGESADDAQQELWLAVFHNLRTLANPAAFRSWLFRSARFRALDFLRRSQREARLLADVPVEAVEIADSPDESAMGEVDDDALRSAMDSLPALQREALLLRYKSDLSYEEIAAVTGTPIGTVRTRLHHGKRKLHDMLGRGKQ